MKKLLIAVIIIAALFVFSGCDAILEGLFPDQTGQWGDGEGSNSIEITVFIPKSTPDWWNSEVIIELREVNDQPIPDTIRYVWPWDPDPMDENADAIATARWDWLPNGEYRVSAWLDINPDGWADEEEPFGTVQTEYGDVFPMPFPNPQNWDELYSDMNFEISLGAVSGGISLIIKGPSVINIADRFFNYTYDIIVASPSAWVTGFDWRLEWAEDDTNYGNSFSDWWDMSFYNAPWAGLNYLVVADNIMLDDGGTPLGPIYLDAEVRLVDEPASASYDLRVEGWGFDGPPYFLTWDQPYDVLISLFSSTTGFIAEASFPGGLHWGGFNLGSLDAGLGPFPYRQTWSVNGIDRVKVQIDTDLDGAFISPNDLVAEKDIGIDIFDPNNGADKYDAYVNTPPFRFLTFEDYGLYW